MTTLRMLKARARWDVFFESAARAWGSDAIGVIPSGANDDGARGMKLIRSFGGTCIAQAPNTAQVEIMPRAAIALAGLETVLSPDGIGKLLVRLAPRNDARKNEEVAG